MKSPSELRAAAQALAARIGPRAHVDLAIWSHYIFDRDPPARVTIRDGEIGPLNVMADTFEEALAKAESEWESNRDELRAREIERTRAHLAELVGEAA